MSSRRASIGAVLLLAAAALSGCQASGLAGIGGPDLALEQPPRETLVASAKEAFVAGDFPGAERTFAAVVARDGSDAEALLGLAATYDRLARWQDADATYARVIAVAGRRPEILNNLATSYFLRGDLGRARVVFEEAARLDPANPVLQANLALLSS